MSRRCSRQMRKLACAVRSAIIVAVILIAAAVQAGEKYDLSTPTATFRSVGLAIKNDDPKTLYKIIFARTALPYDWFVDTVWKGSNPEVPRFLSYSAALQASKTPSDYFLQSEVLTERVGEAEKAAVSDRVLIVRWKEGGIHRKEEFVRLANETTWHWITANPFSHDHRSHDLSTPKNAYLAVSLALRLGVVSEVCNAYSTTVCGGLGVKELERILNDRLSALSKNGRIQAWEQLRMAGSEDELEIEMLPPGAGRGSVKAKVWRVGSPLGAKVGGPKLSFETFIQEGNEWKWLPKPNCFWYPTKAEKPEKAP